MPASLRLLVCQYYLREAQAILQSKGFEDVTVSVYPDICSRPRADKVAAMERLFEESGGDGRTAILVGVCCRLQCGAGGLKEDGFHRVYREDLCFHLLLNKTLVESCLRSGSHLVTAGWLEHWQQHIDDWQFDRQTAREFFAEGARRMVLLDTGLDPSAENRLQACAAFLGLPAEVMPVGLDHFRLVLDGLVQAWRREEALRQAKPAPDNANRKLADYVLAMDLLVKLTRIMTEEEAIQAILDLFAMLFGAGRVAYVATDSGQPDANVRGRPGSDPAGWTQTWIARLKPEDAYAATATGFCVRVTYQNETLGTLIADDFTLPDRQQDYLNLALGIVNLCGLALINARSISQRQRVEENLRHTSEELARSNAELDQFAHVASHDLQAPLRRIISFGDLLSSDCAAELSHTGRDYVARMRQSAERMQRLIEGLLAYSRVTTEGKPFGAVPLSAPVQHAIEDLAQRIEEKGAQVEVDVGRLPTVLGDELQMYQLFLNLIGNAIKFVPKGCAPRVCVSCRRIDRGMVEIKIQDNGIGFDETYADKIFQSFQRLHTEQEYPGSGMGLAICQKIVNRHGGTITAHSRPGEGAAFVLCLPESDAGGLQPHREAT